MVATDRHIPFLTPAGLWATWAVVASFSASVCCAGEVAGGTRLWTLPVYRGQSPETTRPFRHPHRHQLPAPN